MPYDLSRVDVRVKWLVTCLLATFGLAYLFGGIMVALYSGFTPARVAKTYVEPTETAAPETTMVMEHHMQMGDFSSMDTSETHLVDTNLLVQDTHVHVPMYGIFAAALSIVVLGLGLSRARGIGLILLLFAAPWLDFAGMWIAKFVTPHGAVLTVVGGFAMGLGYLIVTALAVRRMWFAPSPERTRT